MVKQTPNIIRYFFVLAISTILFGIAFDLAGAGLQFVYQIVPGWVILLELILISVFIGYLTSRISGVLYPWSMLYVASIPPLWIFGYFAFVLFKDGRIEIEKPQLIITVAVIQVVFIAVGAYVAHVFKKHRKQ